MLKHPDPLSSLDLNLLYTFRAFAELGSLRATAARLGRSQPAISARLHQLEDELGTPLFVREGRRLSLTPFGRAFRARLEPLFGGLSALVDHARAASDRPSGVLRVGVLPTVGVYVVAPRIARLRARHPDVEVELAYGLGSAHVEALRAGRLDLALGVGDAPRDLEVVEIGVARAVLAFRKKKGPRLPARAIRPRPLRALEWVGYGRIGDAFFDAVWSFMEAHGLDTRVAVRAPNIHTLKALVAAGAGVAIVPDYTVVERELDTRRVSGLDVSHPIWLAARPSAVPIPIIAAGIEALSEGE